MLDILIEERANYHEFFKSINSILFPVLQKEFEVPPYSQPVELGSQIELRCHPPKGVPKPRVSFKIFE